MVEGEVATAYNRSRTFSVVTHNPILFVQAPHKCKHNSKKKKSDKKQSRDNKIKKKKLKKKKRKKKYALKLYQT